MEKNIYLAGVGGQGLQVAGKAIASVADGKGLGVTFSPKYGTEKRGGLTSCFIVISDDVVGNPRKRLQDVLLVMEPKAYSNFGKDVRPGGVLIVNSTLVKANSPAPEGASRIDIPFHDLCLELNNTKVISAVVLGALAYVLKDVFPDAAELKGCLLEKVKSRPELMDLNSRAFDMGHNYAGTLL